MTLNKLLVNFNRNESYENQADLSEKIGKFGLGLLRIGFGKTFEVRKLILNQRSALTYKSHIYSIGERVGAIALFILALPITALLAGIGCVGVAFSNSHHQMFDLYKQNKRMKTNDRTTNQTKRKSTQIKITSAASVNKNSIQVSRIGGRSKIDECRSLVFGLSENKLMPMVEIRPPNSWLPKYESYEGCPFDALLKIAQSKTSSKFDDNLEIVLSNPSNSIISENELIQFLLKKEESGNPRFCTLFSSRDTKYILELFKKKNISINLMEMLPEGKILFNILAKKVGIECLLSFDNLQIDLEAKDSNGETLFTFWARKGDIKATRGFLQINPHIIKQVEGHSAYNFVQSVLQIIEEELVFKNETVKALHVIKADEYTSESVSKIIDICYRLFKRDPSNRFVCGDRTKLCQLLIKENPDLNEITQTITNLFDEYVIKEKNKISKYKDEVGVYWNPNGKVQPDTIVTINHGGGLRYILDCFDGAEEGYPLERGGSGIQVHPDAPECPIAETKNRPEYYAQKHISSHFDFPSILTGKVQAKYLLPANNSYEAGITLPNLKYIQDAKIVLHDDPLKMQVKNKSDSYLFNQYIPNELRDRMNKFNHKEPALSSL